jgi:bacterioferritin
MQENQRAELIAGLNDDLAHEYASVIQYRTFASAVRGPHRLTLRPMFAAEVADELGHAELLADTIVTLGGTPSVMPAPVVFVGDTRAMLRLAAEAEGEAIVRYVDHRRIAEALGEHALVVALDEIIADETRIATTTLLEHGGVGAGQPQRGVRQGPNEPEHVRVDAVATRQQLRNPERATQRVVLTADNQQWAANGGSVP